MASRPQLPELDWRVDGARRRSSARLPRGVPRPGLARLLLPEGGVGAARHAVRARAEGARLRARHARTSSRRPTPSGARSSGATGRRSRSSRARRSASRPRRTATRSGRRKPDLYCAIAQGRAARPRARRPRRLDHRPPPRPVADARERAEGSAGTRRTSSGRRTRSPTGTTSAAGPTSASAACRTTRSTTAATPRSATRTDDAGRRPRGPLGGRPRQHPSAALAQWREETARERARLRRLAHRPLGRRQVDDRAPRRRRARAARRARRPPRRRRRPRAPSKGLGFSKEDRDTNIERIGWVASRLARAGAAVVVSAISPYEEARQKARALTEEHAPFVEVYVATSLEECARRDPKGLYAKAHAGEIAEFTGVSDPYEEPSNRRAAARHRGPHAGAVGALVLAKLEELGLIADEVAA